MGRAPLPAGARGAQNRPGRAGYRLHCFRCGCPIEDRREVRRSSRGKFPLCAECKGDEQDHEQRDSLEDAYTTCCNICGAPGPPTHCESILRTQLGGEY